MMEFWCVVSKFFDNGRVDAKILKLVGDEIPDDRAISDIAFDEYISYFVSCEDALEYYQGCMRA